MNISICLGWFPFESYFVNVNLQFNLHLEGWSMDKNMVSKIRIGMSSTNIHLFQFKIQSHLQKRWLWMPVPGASKLIPKKKQLFKICDITFAILPYSH